MRKVLSFPWHFFICSHVLSMIFLAFVSRIAFLLVQVGRKKISYFFFFAMISSYMWNVLCFLKLIINCCISFNIKCFFISLLLPRQWMQRILNHFCFIFFSHFNLFIFPILEFMYALIFVTLCSHTLRLDEWLLF